MKKNLHRTICYATLVVSVAFLGHSSAESSEGVLRARLRLDAGQDDVVARCIRESGQAEDLRETRYLDDAPLPALNPAEQQRGFVIFHRHWMDLVFPNSIPRRSEITNKLGGFLSLGEYEPLTFCVRTLVDLRGLEVKVGELVSPDGDRIAAPEVQIVRCVPRLLRGAQPLYEEGPVGVMNMPTYLEQPRLLDVSAGLTVRYWLTVKVEQDAVPGTYRGEIQLSQEEGAGHRIEIELEVLPVSLIEPPHTLGFWDFQRPYFGEIGPLDQVYQIMSRHGINAVFSRAGLYEYDKPTDTYDFSRSISIDDAGRVTVSLEGTLLEKHLDAAQRAGFGRVVYSPHHWIYVSQVVQQRMERDSLEQQTQAELDRVHSRYEASPYHDMMMQETNNAGKKMFPMYSDAYAKLYVEILRQLLAEVEKRDWPELLVDPGDETYSHHVHDRVSFPNVVRHLELMKRAGATTILNHISPTMTGVYGEYVRDALRFLDIGMPGLRLSANHPYRTTIRKTASAFTERGLTTFTYSMSGASGVIPDLSISRFNAGFFFHTHGSEVRGEFDYIFYRPEGNPYNPADVHRLWSHERLWYFPPQESSNRLGGRALVLAAKREGFDDLRYLETLDALIERAESVANSGESPQLARAAAATRMRILESFHFTDRALDSNRRASASRWDMLSASPDVDPVVQGSFRLNNGWDFEAYDRNRREIAEAIVQIQKELKLEPND